MIKATFFLIFYVLAFPMMIYAEDYKVLSTGLNYRRAPYSFKEKGKLYGLDVEISNEVFKQLNYKSEYIDISHARGIKLLQDNEIDYAVGVVQEGQGNGQLWSSRPFRSEIITIVVRRQDQNKYLLNDLSDLNRYSNVTIAARRGAWLGDKFETFIKSKPRLRDKIIFLPRTEQRLRLLLSNRVDVLVGDKYALLYMAKKMGNENDIFITDVVVNKANVCYLFNKEKISQTFADNLDLAIARVWANERYFQLFEKYQ